MQIQDQRKELERLHEQLDNEAYECQLWAQHLHDAINQSLFSAGLIAEVLVRLCERDQAAALRSPEDLRRLTFGAMAEMRAMLAESRTATLAGSDFANLLTLLGNAVAGRLNIPVSVQAKGKNPIPPEAQVALYHLCKVILNIITQRTNVHKVTVVIIENHSRIEVHLYEEGDTFEIPDAASPQYSNFQSILKRAEAYGASLEIKPPNEWFY